MDLYQKHSKRLCWLTRNDKPAAKRFLDCFSRYDQDKIILQMQKNWQKGSFASAEEAKK